MGPVSSCNAVIMDAIVDDIIKQQFMRDAQLDQAAVKEILAATTPLPLVLANIVVGYLPCNGHTNQNLEISVVAK